jgi:hypothetical protein
MTPMRVQLSRRKGWRMPPNTVKVDRSTRWGNPWTPDAFADPVEEYRASIGWSDMVPSAGEIMHHLRGKNLACWCRPGSPCHADVLLEIANAPICVAVAQPRTAGEERT